MKVAEAEGTLEEMLSKARLDEAKLWDLHTTKTSKATLSMGTEVEEKCQRARSSADKMDKQWNSCRGYGHITQLCPK